MTHIALFMAGMDSTGVAIWILGGIVIFLLILLATVVLGRRKI